jgi:hypothetical protein
MRRVDEDALTAAIVALASRYGRYGYRRVTALVTRPGSGWARIECSGSGGGKG